MQFDRICFVLYCHNFQDVYLRKKALIIFSSDMSSLAAEGGIRNYVKQFISSRTDLDIDLLTVETGIFQKYQMQKMCSLKK